MINSNQLDYSCVRCRSRFSGKAELCRECTKYPLVDHVENRMIERLKSENIYKFMNWKFRVAECKWEDSEKNYRGRDYVVVSCYKRLFNPENPNATLSVSFFEGTARDVQAMRRAAAWLIAHWWEHYFDICPCVHGKRDDEEGSNFRKAMIESLLWYEATL